MAQNKCHPCHRFEPTPAPLEALRQPQPGKSINHRQLTTGNDLEQFFNRGKLPISFLNFGVGHLANTRPLDNKL